MKTEKSQKVFNVSLLIMCLCVSVDMLTTIIAIVFFQGQEQNPLANLIFYKFGLSGFLIALGVQFFMFYIFLNTFPLIVKYFYEKSTNNKFKDDWLSLSFIIIAISYLFTDLSTIFLNILYILVKGGFI